MWFFHWFTFFQWVFAMCNHYIIMISHYFEFVKRNFLEFSQFLNVEKPWKLCAHRGQLRILHRNFMKVQFSPIYRWHSCIKWVFGATLSIFCVISADLIVISCDSRTYHILLYWKRKVYPSPLDIYWYRCYNKSNQGIMYCVFHTKEKNGSCNSRFLHYGLLVGLLATVPPLAHTVTN